MTSDEDILRAFERDPSEGVRELMRVHGTKVKAVLRVSFPSVGESAIDEALSEGLEAVWDRKDALRADRNLGGYLAIIARRRLLRALKAEDRLRLKHQESGPAPDADPEPSLHPDFKAALMACIGQLPPRQRTVLLADLRSGGSVPAEELAADLAVSPSSIWVARSKAKRQVKRCLAQRGFTWGKEEADD